MLTDRCGGGERFNIRKASLVAFLKQSSTLGVRVDADLRADLTKIAARDHAGISQTARRLLAEAVVRELRKRRT